MAAPKFTECQYGILYTYNIHVTIHRYAPSIQRCAQSIESYVRSLTVSKMVCSR